MVYLIAEIGPNHNGSVKLACEMVEKLSAAGADAVKFQLGIPEDVYSSDAFKARYQTENEKSPSPLEMSKKYRLSFDDHKKLYGVCKDAGVDYLCSAFDIKSLKLIDENFDLPFFKIPSGEIFTIDMMEYISGKNRPVLLSTGMSTYDEIKKAIYILNKNSKKAITLLHCVSKYPASTEDVNLLVMDELRMRFSCPVGLSDHTIGNDYAIAAVALGVSVIEKHVTMDKRMEGPDHKASATIEEFASLVRSVRNVERALGSREKNFSDEEMEIKGCVRKSIVSARNIAQGRLITEDDICYKRPGIGFSPIEKDRVIGKKAKRDITINKVIKKEDIG